MGLARLTHIRDNPHETVPVNIYDINTKEIVFNGSQCDAAAFLAIPAGQLTSSLRKKCRIKGQFAVRIAKQQPK